MACKYCGDECYCGRSVGPAWNASYTLDDWMTDARAEEVDDDDLPSVWEELRKTV